MCVCVCVCLCSSCRRRGTRDAPLQQQLLLLLLPLLLLLRRPASMADFIPLQSGAPPDDIEPAGGGAPAQARDERPEPHREPRPKPTQPTTTTEDGASTAAPPSPSRLVPWAAHGGKEYTDPANRRVASCPRGRRWLSPLLVRRWLSWLSLVAHRACHHRRRPGSLDEEIRDFVRYMEPTPAEHRMRLDIIDSIRRAVHRRWPDARVRRAAAPSLSALQQHDRDADSRCRGIGAQVEVFGSFATQLYLPRR